MPIHFISLYSELWLSLLITQSFRFNFIFVSLRRQNSQISHDSDSNSGSLAPMDALSICYFVCMLVSFDWCKLFLLLIPLCSVIWIGMCRTMGLVKKEYEFLKEIGLGSSNIGGYINGRWKATGSSINTVNPSNNKVHLMITFLFSSWQIFPTNFCLLLFVIN